MQSFLRWAGSKRLLLNDLAAYWPADATRYVEPFAGSACLFFHLQPQHALLSDLNSELIDTYRALQRDADLVLEAFRRLPRGENSYYRIREQNPRTLSSVQAAARFLYLNRYCFNGLFRTNKSGVFNVPYGPPKRPLVNFEQRVREASRLLSGVEFISADFEHVVDEIAKGDFVYLDPPYVMDETRVFSDYLAASFSTKDLVRLESMLRKIDDAGAYFLLSYANSREARRLAKPWRSEKVSSQRNIAGFVGARKIAVELLVTNIPEEKPA